MKQERKPIEGTLRPEGEKNIEVVKLKEILKSYTKELLIFTREIEKISEYILSDTKEIEKLQESIELNEKGLDHLSRDEDSYSLTQYKISSFKKEIQELNKRIYVNQSLLKIKNDYSIVILDFINKYDSEIQEILKADKELKDELTKLGIEMKN